MRSLRWLEALLLLSSAIAAWLFYLRLPHHLPTPADRAAVAKQLANEARPGDVLLLFPWWTERARLDAPPGLPVVGYLGSEKESLETHPRIWLLSQPELPGANGDAFQEHFRPGRSSEGAPRSFGTFRLERFRNERYRPPLISSTDGTPALTSVSLDGAGFESGPCTADGGRISCPGGAFVQGPEWHEVRFRPLQCLWVHPPPAPARLVLTLPEDSIAASVRVDVGIFWEHAAKREAALRPVAITLEGAAALASISLPPGEEGLQTIEQRLLPGGAHGVRLTVQTENPESRELCLSWRLYGSPPPAGGTP